jgi:hypothetical protein
MQNYVSVLCQFLYKILISNVTLYELNFFDDSAEILEGSCAQIVEDCDAISSGDEGICKVRTDESGTTGDESAHGLSLSFEAGARSASIVGPDGALCDALATALMVDGRDAQRWMGRPELAEYSFWVINRDDKTAWSYDQRGVLNNQGK